jgi:hypothetical protein
MDKTPTENRSSDDDAINLMRSLSAEKGSVKQPVQRLITRKDRLLVGLILGATIGVVYGFFSQAVNRLSLPDVPYAEYPFAMMINWAIGIVLGAGIGLACAGPQLFSKAIIVGGIVTFLAVMLQWLITQAKLTATLTPSPLWLIFLFFLFILAVVIAMLFRQAVDAQTEFADKPIWTWTRVRTLLVILVLSSLAGSFSIYPNYVLQGLKDMHALIQSGLSVSDPANLASDLRKENRVVDFLSRADSNYVLEQNRNGYLESDLNKNQYDPGNIAIVARFKSGWRLACAYNSAGMRLHCKSYADVNAFQ